MTIREVTVTDTPTITRKQEMVGVIIHEDKRISAVWAIRRKNGRTLRLTVPVSDALVANITARPTFDTFLDQVNADTFPRTGAT